MQIILKNRRAYKFGNTCNFCSKLSSLTVRKMSHLFKQSLYISDFVFKRFIVLSRAAISLSFSLGSMKATFSWAHLVPVVTDRDKQWY